MPSTTAPPALAAWQVLMISGVAPDWLSATIRYPCQSTVAWYRVYRLGAASPAGRPARSSARYRPNTAALSEEPRARNTIPASGRGRTARTAQIGRASCRGRGEILGG